MTKKVKKIEAVRQSVIKELRPKKRVCAYCRVSTDSTKQHTSYVAQVEYYEKYITKREDWEFAGIFADEAKSGTKLKSRDEFLRMMKACESGQIDVIITKSITRFARNTIDSIEAIRRLKELGVTVYFEKENINTLSEQSEQMLTILSSLAQGESESISSNTRWAVQKRFRDGTYIPGCVAYGYSKDDAGEIIINPEEAMVVRRIYDDYLNGKGAYTIAKTITSEGVPTVRSAKSWSDDVVNEILQNPIYTGDLVLQKTYTTEVLPFKRKHNRGEMPMFKVTDNHQALITRKEAELVQDIFEYRRKLMKIDYSGKYLNRYELSSKIICKSCGGTFRRQKIYIGKPYESVQWSCYNHIKDSKECNMKPIREDIIREAYLNMWNKLVSNQAYILVPLLESLKNLRASESHQDEIQVLNEKIMEITEQSHILSRVVQKGYMDSALFIEKQNALNVELEETKKKRNSLLEASGFESEIKGTESLIEIVKYNPEIMDAYDADLFSNTVDKVIIHHQRAVTFKLINGLELKENYPNEGGDR